MRVRQCVRATLGVAKYRDPKTGATWTGHGRAPNWMATAKNVTSSCLTPAWQLQNLLL
ncbi:H-NS histone family protein [Caballeronia sp. SBC1]|uniref:H-NS histone family protein n=1 Tax=Caballeronia sp. SBC1 TaxID=2705548 RepID=UPI0035301CF6